MVGLGGTNSGVHVQRIRDVVAETGIIVEENTPDPRLQQLWKALEKYKPDHELSEHEFINIASDNLMLLHRIASKEMVIKNFKEFKGHLDSLKSIIEPIEAGKNADYIPILKDVDPNKFGVAFCSVDGQFYESGDTREMFSVQSTCKPIMFALALEKLGQRKILEWCGVEPSGRPFNDLTLMSDERPFNPMINSGALMIAGLLATAFPDIANGDGPYGEDNTYAQRVCEEVLLPLWARLGAADIFERLNVGFSQETFLSERGTANRNIAITHNMKATDKGLPSNVDTQYMIDFYLRSCSITSNAAAMSVVAATLANGGKNPITDDQVFRVDVVKRTLSVLSLCGFYDNSGEFFFDTGIPSKSGVSGIVMMVLPNVGGFAIFSPRLDKYGNSVRGSLFAKELVRTFTFHTFDNLSSLSTGCKLDPRFNCDASRQRHLSRLRWAIKANGKQAIRFDELLVYICFRIALVDGKLGDKERRIIEDSYREVMHLDLSQDRIDKILKILDVPSNELQNLKSHVEEEAMHLNDTEKEVILAVAVKVATADGKACSSERDVLRELADALSIQQWVLKLRLDGWSTELAQQGQSNAARAGCCLS
ncbi:unnamed protein product [Agarophyton chilense]